MNQERRGDDLSTKRSQIKITPEIIPILRFSHPSTVLHYLRLKWTISDDTLEYNQWISLFESNNIRLVHKFCTFGSVELYRSYKTTFSEK